MIITGDSDFCSNCVWAGLVVFCFFYCTKRKKVKLRLTLFVAKSLLQWNLSVFHDQQLKEKKGISTSFLQHSEGQEKLRQSCKRSKVIKFKGGKGGTKTEKVYIYI